MNTRSIEIKEDMLLRPIGRVVSEHQERSGLPHQGRGKALRAVIEIFREYEPAMREIRPGQTIWVLGWFHLSDRSILRSHPKGNQNIPPVGVFSLRSPVRPNPISMSLVDVEDIEGTRIAVKGLELLDGTPVLDIKPHVAALDA